MRGRGQVWAYAGAFVGGSVSVVANVAHSYRPPEGAAPDWQPRQLAVGLAGFWPLAVLLAVEIMARVDWPNELRWMLVRFAGLTPIAAVAAIVSYRHLSGLLDWYQEDRVTVTIGPFAVDGLMVISSGALLALRARPADRVERVKSIGRLSRIRSRVAGWIASIGSRRRIESGGPVESTPAIAPAAAVTAVNGSGRPLVLDTDRVTRPLVSAPVGVEDDYLTRARLMIAAGELPATPSAERIMAALKPCGPKRARAIRDAIKGEEAQSPRAKRNQERQAETGQRSDESSEETQPRDEREQLSE